MKLILFTIVALLLFEVSFNIKIKTKENKPQIDEKEAEEEEKGLDMLNNEVEEYLEHEDDLSYFDRQKKSTESEILNNEAEEEAKEIQSEMKDNIEIKENNSSIGEIESANEDLDDIDD